MILETSVDRLSLRAMHPAKRAIGSAQLRFLG